MVPSMVSVGLFIRLRVDDEEEFGFVTVEFEEMSLHPGFYWRQAGMNVRVG